MCCSVDRRGLSGDSPKLSVVEIVESSKLSVVEIVESCDITL